MTRVADMNGPGPPTGRSSSLLWWPLRRPYERVPHLLGVQDRYRVPRNSHRHEHHGSTRLAMPAPGVNLGTDRGRMI